MSTKIYRAWRIPISKLGEFSVLCHDRMFEKVVAKMRKLMGTVLDEFVAKEMGRPDRIKREGKREKKVREDYIRFQECKRLLAGLHTKDPHSWLCNPLYCGFTAYVRGRWAYIIPYGEDRFAPIKFRERWVEDYRYFNNTDRPASISAREWNRRGDEWHSIFEGNFYRRLGLINQVMDTNPVEWNLWFDLEWYMVGSKMWRPRKKVRSKKRSENK